MRLDLRSGTEWYAFYSGRYDDPFVALIAALLSRTDGAFLDVGGNIGMYAVRVAAALNGKRNALCFEPMPSNAMRIRENAALNGLDNCVLVHEIALSNRTGEVELVLREDFRSGAATGNASIAISDDADRGFQKITIPTRRFDEILLQEGLGPMPVAKVDIEGHEDLFLLGAQEYLKRDRPIIFTEVNNWFYRKRGESISDLFAQAIPREYEAAILKAKGSKVELQRVHLGALATLQRMENCVLFPEDRLGEIIGATV